MRYSVLALFLATFPAQVFADAAVVRGGEHGAFTRLVISFPLGVKWKIADKVVENEISVVLDDEGVVFDTSQSFSRISRARISDVEFFPEKQSLNISISCDCRSSSFVTNERFLVIDVAERSINLSNSASEEVRLDSEIPGLGESQSISEEVSYLPNAVEDLLEIRLGSTPGIGPMHRPSFIRSIISGGYAAHIQSVAGKTFEYDGKNIVDVRSEILRSLAFAATEGTLNPVATQLGSVDSEVTNYAVRDSLYAGNLAKQEPLTTQLATALSSLGAESDQLEHLEVGGLNCISDRDLDLSSWRTPERDIAIIMANHRSFIFDEIDRVDTQKSKIYTKYLLSSGFGAEAREVINIGTKNSSDILLSLSYLVDGETDPNSTFDMQYGCPGAAAFWSLLSKSEIETDLTIDHDAVLRAFEALPKHIREYLGPILATKMTTAEFHETAKEILRRLERVTGGETDIIALSRAQIDIEEGRHEAADARLTTLSLNSHGFAPKSIVSRIDLANRVDGFVPDRIVELAEAYSYELRGSVYYPDIWKASIIGSIVNGDFDKSIEKLKESSEIDDDTLYETYNLLFERLSRKASSEVFLKYAARKFSVILQSKMSEENILLFADRLVSIGLPDLALTFLDFRHEFKNVEHEKLLRARVYLGMSRPEEADIVLLGLRSNEANRLRALARERMGDFSLATEIFSSLGDHEQARTTAWLSGNFESLAAQGGDDAISLVRDLALHDDKYIDSSEVSLHSAERLVESSSIVRNKLRRLVDETASH